MCFAAPAHLTAMDGGNAGGLQEQSLPCAMAGIQEDCRNNPCRRITRTLVRAGVLVEDPEQPWLDLEPGSPLEHLAAAAVRYRALLDDAIRRRDILETLLAQQVILEGLGDVVLDRISAGMTERGMGFARLRRTLLNQEHAHHIFGLRRLEQLIDTGRASAASLRERGKEYLALTDTILAVHGDLFEAFDEDPIAYASAARRHMPGWLTEDQK